MEKDNDSTKKGHEEAKLKEKEAGDEPEVKFRPNKSKGVDCKEDQERRVESRKE